MNWGILIPLAIFTVGPISWAFTTWVRAKHGYPLDDRGHRAAMKNWGWHGHWHTRDDDTDGDRKIALLSTENEALVGRIGRLEERIAVLERIATDPAERTAREIDALRNA